MGCIKTKSMLPLQEYYGFEEEFKMLFKDSAHEKWMLKLLGVCVFSKLGNLLFKTIETDQDYYYSLKVISPRKMMVILAVHPL